MVTIEENKVIIEIESPSPEMFVECLREGIITSLQAHTKLSPEMGVDEGLQTADFFLLELLTAIWNNKKL